MTTAWRIPLSAHVCTTEDAPAAAHAGIFLVLAPASHANARVLLDKYKKLKDGIYRGALWYGYCSLADEAHNDLEYVIKRGALLHFGNQKATAIAQQAREAARATQPMKLQEVPAC